MAAGLGFIEFSTGDVLSAAAANGYLASQTVMVFASSAARSSAITSPQEGMFSYLKDTNATQFYDGAAWTNLDSTGGMTSIASGSLSGASLALTSIVGTYKNLVLVLRNYTTGTDFDLNCKINSLTTAGDYSYTIIESATTNAAAPATASYYNSTVFGLNNALIDNTDGDNSLVLTVNDYADTTANKTMTAFEMYKRSTGQKTVLQVFGSVNTTAAVTAITLTPSAGTWSAGTYTLYGVN